MAEQDTVQIRGGEACEGHRRKLCGGTEHAFAAESCDEVDEIENKDSKACPGQRHGGKDKYSVDGETVYRYEWLTSPMLDVQKDEQQYKPGDEGCDAGRRAPADGGSLIPSYVK